MDVGYHTLRKGHPTLRPSQQEDYPELRGALRSAHDNEQHRLCSHADDGSGRLSCSYLGDEKHSSSVSPLELPPLQHRDSVFCGDVNLSHEVH